LLARDVPQELFPGREWVDLVFRRPLPTWAETLRIVGECELVVTVDCSVAHIAGALGVPCHILLAEPCDWRWAGHPTTTLWYPRARLFRQARPGDWASVVGAMARTLR
jgi:hypothetical protein